VEQLLARGEAVRVFDLRKGFEDSRVKFFVGNIRSEDDLRPALTGVTTVYNTVSPPHGIKEEREKKREEKRGKRKKRGG
jgi:nucleoside-diphosphate-sugar epimerase